MATVTLNRSDIFPIGTTVGIYPASSVNPNTGIPSGAAIASAAVDAAGLLTVTNGSILSLTPYVAHAVVSSVPQTARVRSTLDVEDRGTATGTVTTTAASRSITTVLSTGTLAVGQRFVSANVPGGARIVSGSGTAWVLSTPASGSAAGTAFYAEGAKTPVSYSAGTSQRAPGTTWAAHVAQRRALIGTS